MTYKIYFASLLADGYQVDMRWQKGQSGNPKGRKPDEQFRKLREAFLSDCPKARQVILDALNDDDPEIRLKAAAMVLDRGIGKPTQAVEMSGPNGGPIENVNYSEMPTEKLRALLAAEIAKEKAK